MRATHDLRSISKSIVGLLYGIAQDAGQVPAVQTPALRAFDDVADLRNPARDAIQVEHLLTMTSGLQWSEPSAAYGSLTSDETRLFWTASAHRFLFARDVEAPPGTRFNYNGANTAALAELLAIGTGLDLRDQARRDLFEPLGITDWEWIGDLRGRPIAFAGLRLKPRDLARIGRLLLDHGRWRGRQIVPARWIDASLQARVDVGDGLQYGYQWWLGSATDASGAGRRWAGAFGNGGQRLYVVPELDLSVTITAGDYNSAPIARAVGGVFRAIVAGATP